MDACWKRREMSLSESYFRYQAASTFIVVMSVLLLNPISQTKTAYAQGQCVKLLRNTAPNKIKLSFKSNCDEVVEVGYCAFMVHQNGWVSDSCKPSTSRLVNEIGFIYDGLRFELTGLITLHPGQERNITRVERCRADKDSPDCNRFRYRSEEEIKREKKDVNHIASHRKDTKGVYIALPIEREILYYACPEWYNGVIVKEHNRGKPTKVECCRPRSFNCLPSIGDPGNVWYQHGSR